MLNFWHNTIHKAESIDSNLWQSIGISSSWFYSHVGYWILFLEFFNKTLLILPYECKSKQLMDSGFFMFYLLHWLCLKNSHKLFMAPKKCEHKQ